MIELTAEQAKALQTQAGPLSLLDPRTREVYVLVPQDVYELVRGIIRPANRAGWDNVADDDLIKKNA